VSLLVTGLTEPSNVKRFVIVFVVSNAFWIAASFTFGSNKNTLDNCSANLVMCSASAFILIPPNSIDFEVMLDSFGKFCSSSVVLSDFFNVVDTMFTYVFLCTCFAFIEMTVSHSLVFIKLLYRLDGLALKTLFRTNHVVLLCCGGTTIIDPF